MFWFHPPIVIFVRVSSEVSEGFTQHNPFTRPLGVVGTSMDIQLLVCGFDVCFNIQHPAPLEPLTFVHSSVQKGDFFVRAFGCEFDCRVYAIDVIQVLIKLLLASSVDDKNVIYESPLKENKISGHGLQGLLHMTHEYAGICRSTAGPHCTSLDLEIMLALKLKDVVRKDNIDHVSYYLRWG